jgi:transcription elongation factor Elf1
MDSTREGVQMRDTWIGSGIYSVEIEREFTCADCGWEGLATGTTDDLQAILSAECQNCKYIMEIDLDAEREHEKYFADKDDYWEE